jgi:hypothetical protein
MGPTQVLGIRKASVTPRVQKLEKLSIFCRFLLNFKSIQVNVMFYGISEHFNTRTFNKYVLELLIKL